MRKFILKWGKGSVLGIQAVYKTMTIEEAGQIFEMEPDTTFVVQIQV